MRRIRRLLLVAALFSLVICVVLLLGFTPFNPTHRRYSSAPVLINGNATNIGNSGEDILSADLGIPHNGTTTQRQCICNNGVSGVPTGCTVCLTSVTLATNFRIPDFVGTNFIAEAKNTQILFANQTDLLQQISDYAAAAHALHVPLYLFTRVNTEIDLPYYQLVESTGGHIVRYFAVLGYVDPIDSAARKGLLISGILLGILVMIEVLTIKRHRRTYPSAAISSVNPDVPPRKPTHPIIRATQSVDDVKQFMQSAEDKANDELKKFE